jgi:acyl-CoA thioester hydrolase
MPDFHYYHPIEVRYGDLDPQGHVNNARYLTYMEQARIGYVRRLGLWTGAFLDMGIILADAHLTFHAPILFGQPIRVGARVPRLGNKSFTMECAVQDGRPPDARLADASLAEDPLLFATGTFVLVAYDYRLQATMPVPENWCAAISAFEGLGD